MPQIVNANAFEFRRLAYCSPGPFQIDTRRAIPIARNQIRIALDPGQIRQNTEGGRRQIDRLAPRFRIERQEIGVNAEKLQAVKLWIRRSVVRGPPSCTSGAVGIA